MSGGTVMIKHVEFPDEFINVESVTINDVTFINTLYDDSKTVTLFIPSIKIRSVLQVVPV
jgi:hypothetical protein